MQILNRIQLDKEALSMGASDIAPECIPWIWLLIDSGTFDHLVGTEAMVFAFNIRNITPKPVKTGGNVVFLAQKCDLLLKDRVLQDCYVNPHSDMVACAFNGWV